MITKCPSCQKDVDHEDFLFEVLCSCGARFNPFMPAEVPGFDPISAMSSAEPAAESPPQTDFSESRAVFDELRDFGEAIVPGDIPDVEEKPLSIPIPSAPTPTTARPTAAPRPVVAGGADEIFVTSADSLAGLHIESVLGAVSAVATFAATEDSPLKPVFDQLASQAAAIGATCVIAVRWSLLPDGNRVLASGTAVRARMES